MENVFTLRQSYRRCSAVLGGMEISGYGCSGGLYGRLLGVSRWFAQ